MSLPFPRDEFELTNPDNGQRYLIQIDVPNRYDHDPDRRFPVVVCLDGLWTFGVTRDAFRILPLSRELPEAIVVGVTHADDDLRTVLQLRAVDYTPTSATAPAETGVRLAAHEVGKASHFRRFLLDTVLPLVGDRYRLNDDHTLVGHSFSALFGLDTLLHEPGPFGRWVLASPSVWWDDRVMFRIEGRHAANGGVLRGRLFLSMGDEDHDALGGHEAFYRQLAGRHQPDLRIDWARFAGETHQSVISSALVRGLRMVFKP